MAKNTKIKVMLSSRCNDAFSKDSEITLTDLRRELKKEIESVQLLGREIFEVWINEDAPPSEGNKDTCLKAVRECDVLIVLSNGNAGWALSSEDIGICHAEYMEGLRTAQSKVRFIELPKVANADDVNAQKRNQRYQEYVSKQTPFRGGEIKTVEDAKKCVFDALSDAVILFTLRGIQAVNSTRFDVGSALDWTRLDFRKRKEAMEKTLKAALLGREGSNKIDNEVIVNLNNKKVMTIEHLAKLSTDRFVDNLLPPYRLFFAQ